MSIDKLGVRSIDNFGDLTISIGDNLGVGSIDEFKIGSVEMENSMK